MKLLKILLPIYGWTLAVESQTQYQQRRQAPTNSGAITFVENERQVVEHVPENGTKQGNTALQQNNISQNNNRLNNVDLNKPQANYVPSISTNLNVNNGDTDNFPLSFPYSTLYSPHRQQDYFSNIFSDFNAHFNNPNLNNQNAKNPNDKININNLNNSKLNNLNLSNPNVNNQNFNTHNIKNPNANHPPLNNQHSNNPNLNNQESNNNPSNNQNHNNQNYNQYFNNNNMNNENINNPNYNTHNVKNPNSNNPSLSNPNINNQEFNNPPSNNPYFNKPTYNNIATSDSPYRTEQNPPLHKEQESVLLNHNSRAITHFGLNLLKNIDSHVKNVVLSPYSIATMLGLLQQGALGLARQQIGSVLQMTPEDSAQFNKKITEAIQRRSSRNILEVANNVYVADAFDLNPAFNLTARRNFGSEITPIKFGRTHAVREINNWVASKTNNKIIDLLPPGAVGPNTQLILLNAMYFKGLWQVRFKPESTLQRDFRLLNGATKIVPYMRMRRIFRSGYDRTNNAQIIILPFEKDDYSLMLMLPSEKSNLDALISSLTPRQLAEYQNISPKEVDLELPRFSVRADIELNQVLQKMGVTNIFGDRSDLSNIGTYRTKSPQVSAAIHTAILSVDEDGGTAAAATAFVVVALSYDEPSVVFKANRPFLAVLWDNQLGLPLIMAKVDDPIL